MPFLFHGPQVLVEPLVQILRVILTLTRTWTHLVQILGLCLPAWRLWLQRCQEVLCRGQQGPPAPHLPVVPPRVQHAVWPQRDAVDLLAPMGSKGLQVRVYGFGLGARIEDR